LLSDPWRGASRGVRQVGSGTAPAVSSRKRRTGRLRAGRPTLLRGSAGSPAGRWSGRRRAKACRIGVGAAHPVQTRKNGPGDRNRRDGAPEGARASSPERGITEGQCVIRRSVPFLPYEWKERRGRRTPRLKKQGRSRMPVASFFLGDTARRGACGLRVTIDANFVYLLPAPPRMVYACYEFRNWTSLGWRPRGLWK
jgi:hypothetical protein